MSPNTISTPAAPASAETAGAAPARWATASIEERLQRRRDARVAAAAQAGWLAALR